ncbi:MAG: AbrB/MazE/SpoVT family DNA-binding domain-containing protein [bacterium]|nr:AbrB/MazE/SpoVT family DNA-binding domain-containing protein [bacterium]
MKRTLVKVHESVNSIIPKGVLEHCGLEVGDKLDFRIDGDHIKAIHWSSVKEFCSMKYLIKDCRITRF